MLNKYFKNTSYSVGSLVKEYKKLAHKYHPDAGGTNEDFVAMTKEYESIIEGMEEPTQQSKTKVDNSKNIVIRDDYKYQKSNTEVRVPINDEKHNEIIDFIAPNLAKKIVHPLWIAHWFGVSLTMITLLWLTSGMGWIYSPIGQGIFLLFWIWIAITGCLGWYLFMLLLTIQMFRFEVIQGDVWFITFLWVFGYPIFRFFFYMYRSFTTWSIL